MSKGTVASHEAAGGRSVVPADSTDVVKAPAGDAQMATADAARPARPERPAVPVRPPLASANGAPIIHKQPPPFAVRLSEFLWICSLLVGALTVVYYFVIRKDQTPLIVEIVKGLDGSRPDATYTSAADLIFWTVFWIAAGSLVIQIALLVQFMNRRGGARLWQLATVILQAVTYGLAAGIVATGEKGELLTQLMLGQACLAALALLFGSLTRSLRWTARRVDIRRAGDERS